jgi:hypothetical protein
MKPKPFRWAIALAVLVTASPALAQSTPALLSYQGRVQTGSPAVDFDGVGEFKFALVKGTASISVTATATAVRTGAFITSINVNNQGSGYSSAPTVTISGGGGSGATATAFISGNGIVTSIAVNQPGSGYTGTPTVTLSAPPAKQEFLWVNNGSAANNPVNAVNLPVSGGLYSVLLGDTSIANMAAIPPAIFENPDVRLRVWFNGTLLTPDQRLAPDAFLASDIMLTGRPTIQDRLRIRTDNGTMPLTVGNDASGNTIQLISSQGGSNWHLDFNSDGLGFVETGVAGGRLTLKDGGNIGIGTSSPGYPLDVRGSSSTTGSYYYISYTSGGLINSDFSTAETVTISAEKSIRSSAMVIRSDERIKNVSGRSDSAADLATLTQVAVTDYTMIDPIAGGSGKCKKLIAQQLEEHFPQAVSKTTDVIPDIFKKATASDGWVELGTDLKVGERVRLIGESEAAVYEVLEVADGRFRTDYVEEGEIFVYGREVDDFRTVDYDAVSMLNVSATQELARRLELAEAEIAGLKNRLADQEKLIDHKLARLSHLLEVSALPVPVSTPHGVKATAAR